MKFLYPEVSFPKWKNHSRENGANYIHQITVDLGGFKQTSENKPSMHWIWYHFSGLKHEILHLAGKQQAVASLTTTSRTTKCILKNTIGILNISHWKPQSNHNHAPHDTAAGLFIFIARVRGILEANAWHASQLISSHYRISYQSITSYPGVPKAEPLCFGIVAFANMMYTCNT